MTYPNYINSLNTMHISCINFLNTMHRRVYPCPECGNIPNLQITINSTSPVVTVFCSCGLEVIATDITKAVDEWNKLYEEYYV
jgi:transcription elongation factor Elf1